VIDTLAYQPDPYPAHATLRDRGLHRRADGRWVVARAGDVTEVLTTPAAVVGFRHSGNTPDSALATIQSNMARFSDGPAHDRRRAITCGLLDVLSPGALRAEARALTRERLDGMHDVDVMHLIARTVPVTVLAKALGITDLDTAVAAARQLCLALAPPHSPAPGIHDANLPGTLRRLVAPVIGERGTDEQIANVVAVLFQAMDATAGLIGNAVVAAHRREPTGSDIQALIATTNRDDPSVQLTTRVAAAPVRVAGHTIPAGDRIVVVLAAANHDTGTDFTFGAGLRPCPGRTHALALATGVVEALITARARLADHEIGYEHRSNLRIPAHLSVRLG
jgi:cytochrome P450